MKPDWETIRQASVTIDGVEYSFEVLADWSRINPLAVKAAHNKKRWTKTGPFRVRITGEEPVQTSALLPPPIDRTDEQGELTQ